MDDTGKEAEVVPKIKKPWVEPPLTPRTTEELKQLAIDIIENRVYTDAFHEDGVEAFKMFFTLFLGSLPSDYDVTQEQLKTYLGKFGMIYEYYDKASSRSINGKPSFFSINILPAINMEELRGYLIKLDEAKKNL